MFSVVFKFLLVMSLTVTFVGCGGASGGAGAGPENNESEAAITNCIEGFVFDEDLQQCIVDTTETSCGSVAYWDQDLETCIDLYWVCADGTQYPNDYVPNEFSTQNDCVVNGYDGPTPEYFPTADEVVIYFNKEHVDSDYSGYNFFGYGSCWAGSYSWPGNPLPQIIGVDPNYGAYFTVELEPECADLNTLFVINTGVAGDQTDDLYIQVNDFDGMPSLYTRMAFLITGDEGQLRTSGGARYSSGTPILSDYAPIFLQR